MHNHGLQCAGIQNVRLSTFLIDPDVVPQEHNQVDGPFAAVDAHFDKESWSFLFARITGHGSRAEVV